MVSSASRASSGPCSMFWSSSASSCAAIASTSSSSDRPLSTSATRRARSSSDSPSVSSWSARILQPLAHGVVGLDPALELLDLLHYHPGLVRVGPHAALGHGVLQLGQPLRLPVYVKGSS